jgi:hypothetical protein
MRADLQFCSFFVPCPEAYSSFRMLEAHGSKSTVLLRNVKEFLK